MSLSRLLLPLAICLGACVKRVNIEVLEPVTPAPAASARPLGQLDKDQIRAVIGANRAQIRGCYETRLESAPNLRGKVVIRFVIGADGQVLESKVRESTVGDAELEGCVTARVGTFRFPPTGGGVVIVTYPFIFKTSPEG
ncbi:AgmX/PglI C-terminal domain-containing protein [Pyxidicoccus sp. MSG2]|uniref:AgmX/PglI C-terminal domain-containing protein n=1 Tax=Pyxidicoccus sp. MSG2 TaxID=2996790 RepID=UPI00226E701D|nr:AgmX/PglI C-terminal domain-containing protein [Pyxidicoccus sp. MSG2]MCY1015852.1 AgmX/PglI C-terminal domain-containing protein [Pyxidicoccus sp. MSG2]